MKNWKMIGWVTGIPVLVIILILIILCYEPRGNGIGRAEAAKSIVLALISPEELKAWNKEQASSHFPADSLDEWYVPYLDYLYGQGIFQEDITPAAEKSAEGALTYREAAQAVNMLAPQSAELVRMTRNNQDEPFPEEQWWLLYDSILKAADPDGAVAKTTMIVYGTPDNTASAPPWTAYTSLGTIGFSGLALDAYVDHEVRVYIRDSELIHVLEDRGSDVTYRNVWIRDGDEQGLTVFVGDMERRLEFRKPSKKGETLIGNLADLQMEEGKITKVSVKKDRITGRVLSVQEDAVEIEGYGLVPLDSEYKVLKTYGEVERQTLKDILVGYDLQEFVVAKGKICGALTVRAFDADRIRVLLMDTGFKNLLHTGITLSCSTGMTMIQGEEKQEIGAGEQLTFTPEDACFADGRIMLEPKNGGEIQVLSISRSQGTPSYSGRLEITREEGGLALINDIYMEDYLKRVVPSEMPASYEKEALKAQAVCARTYAYMQIQSNTYSQYGAQVDDSTNFQVYNNVESNERTDAAVQETYGKILLYEGAPVQAYYFSTSCGMTTDNSVWGSDPADAPYLIWGSVQAGRKQLDLTTNDAFSSYIKDTGISAYDSDAPFFRWSTTTDTTVLTANIGGIGTVQKLRITERGPGGVAKTLVVTGSEGEKTISGQNAIRAALGDASLTIQRGDGKTVEGWSSLPSGFLSIEDAGTTDAGVRRFKIYGGGYGHGVGMSQNGAQGMAKEGMDYQEILEFYYDGTEIAEDGAVRQSEEN